MDLPVTHCGRRGLGDQRARSIGKQFDHGVLQAASGEDTAGPLDGELEYLPQGSRARRPGTS